MQFIHSNLFGNIVTVFIVALFFWTVLRARRQPLWAEAYRRLGRNKLALLSLAVLGAYAGIAVLDSISYDDAATHQPKTVVDRLFSRPVELTYSAPFASYTTAELVPHKLKQPGSHWLGTNGVGEDIMFKTIKGVRTAMIIGCFTTLIAVPLALILGLLAGYFGKFVDDAIQYTYTVMASIPDVLLLIAIILVLDRGLVQICIALGVTTWIALCRLVRGETLKHREREYVRAAKALGASNWRIVTRHILPNLLPVVVISITLNFSYLVLTEAVLTYLGVGVSADVGSWGNMIDSARDELARNPMIWWNVGSATVALLILVLALNVFGDALRDAIDPRLRSS